MRRPLALLLAVALLATAAAAATTPPAEKKPAAKKSEAKKSETKKSDAKKAAEPPDDFAGLELRGIGPAITSGRIVDIAVHPSDRNTWYVAVASGGVWKTDQRRHDLDADLRRRGLVLDRLRHDRSARTRSSSGSAPARTTASAASATATASTSPIDGGKSWKNVGLKKSEHIGKIVVDPRDSQRRLRRRAGPALGAGRRPRPLQDRPTAARPGSACSTISENTGVTDVVLRPAQPRRALRRGLPARAATSGR